MLFDLRRQALVGHIVFGNHQQTAGVFIDAVNNAGANYPIDARKRIATMIQQCIDQGAVAVAGCRVYYHPFGLVDHEQVLVLVHNRQGNILRDYVKRLGVGQQYLYFLAGQYPVVFGQRCSTAQHRALCHQLLHAGTGQVRKQLANRLVCPGIALSLFYHKQLFAQASHLLSKIEKTHEKPPYSGPHVSN